MRYADSSTGALSHSGLVWLAVLAVTALFQFFRGALFDAAVFGSATIGLFLVEMRGHPRPRHATTPGFAQATRIILVSGGLLLLLPVPRALHQLVLLTIAAVAIISLAAARPTPLLRPEKTPMLRRTEALWAGVLVLVCLWEVTAFFLASPGPAAAYDHPTISALVDPLVTSELGRIAFVAVWLLLGWTLLPRRVVKSCAN